MTDKLTDWLFPGVLQNEEDHRIARIQLTLILAHWFTSLIVLILDQVWGNKSLTPFLITGAILQVMPIMLLRYGKLVISGLATTTIYLFIGTYFATIGQGIHDYVIIIYPIIIMMAGLTSHRRGLVSSTILTLGAIAWLVIGEINGWIVPVGFTASLPDLAAASVLVLIGSLAVHLLVSNLEYGLAQTWQELAKRKRVEKALRESEDNLKEIFENSPDNIFVFEVCGGDKYRVKKLNSALMNIFEAGIGGIEGKYLDEIIDKEHADVIAQNFQRCIQAKTRLQYEEHADLPGKFYSTHLIPILDDAGNVTRLIGISRDITARKQAEDALQKVNEQLSLKLAEIEKLHDELREQSIRDPLTGLFNRRVMQEMFEREFSRARRENDPLSVIMLDMDDLKAINDTYGHHMGDVAIQRLTSLLQSMTRKEDVAVRYAGDEFVILLNNTDPAEARKRVDEWRDALVGQAVDAGERGQFTVQFTAGIASFPVHGLAMKEIVNNADMALYRAKAQGRNCTVIFN